jgi:hypothetical protein
VIELNGAVDFTAEYSRSEDVFVAATRELERAATLSTPSVGGEPMLSSLWEGVASRSATMRRMPSATTGCSRSSSLRSPPHSAKKSSGDSAVTVAVRRPPSRSAISPKKSPGPSVRIAPPPSLVTLTVPPSITKNE